LGKKEGIKVWGGAELNTREEVHCLAFFDDLQVLDVFQVWLDQWLMVIKNRPESFGDQVWVDEHDNILGEEERLLIASLNRSMLQSYEEVHRLGGVFVPAHIDRKSNSLTSQLGFVPPDIMADALEVSSNVSPELLKMKGWEKIRPLITGSDAHQPERLGTRTTNLKMKNTSLEEFKKALNEEGGRGVAIGGI
ncbi:MAG: PHP-associated domain-containing protein, partial [Bacteroidota bacterium]